MAQTRNYVAIDLGAESGRVIIGRLNDGRLSLSEVHRFPNIPTRLPDGLHWDVLRLFNEMKRGLIAASRECDGHVDGIGVDTWGVDFGLLDRTGSLIGNPYMYRDSRTDGMVEEAFKIVPKEEIFAQTGIQFLQLNTLIQLFSMVRSNDPAFKIAETLLTMPDLFNYWLTGRKGCEFTNATTTQCYDPRRAVWAAPLLQRLGIPTHIFPEIIPTGTILGPLLPDLAKELELPGAVVIAPASHDTGSAIGAVPATEGRHAWISSGTWSLMGSSVESPIINEKTLAYNLTNEGGIEGEILLLKNIQGLWFIEETRREWEAQGETFTYDELAAMAASAPRLRSIVEPDAPEFLRPGGITGRLQDFCRRTGQPIPETKGEILRCFLESLALKYRMVLEQLQDLLGYSLETIHIVGGGSKNRQLSQWAADATGARVITGPAEATSTGNVLVQAMALGEIKSVEGLHDVVRCSFSVETFDPIDRTGWDEAYQKFLSLGS